MIRLAVEIRWRFRFALLKEAPDTAANVPMRSARKVRRRLRFRIVLSIGCFNPIAFRPWGGGYHKTAADIPLISRQAYIKILYELRWIYQERIRNL